MSGHWDGSAGACAVGSIYIYVVCIIIKIIIIVIIKIIIINKTIIIEPPRP